jgi:hypothetical protein
MSSNEEKNKYIVIRYNKEFIEKLDMDVFEETIASDFVNRTPRQGVPADREGVTHFFNECCVAPSRISRSPSTTRSSSSVWRRPGSRLSSP